VTRLNRIGRKLGLRVVENRLGHEAGKRAKYTPLQAELPERCTETLDPGLSETNDVGPSRNLNPAEDPRTHRYVPGVRYVRGHTGTSAGVRIFFDRALAVDGDDGFT
jgi:hypothetical protein